eukprot:s14644_g1.t1
MVHPNTRRSTALLVLVALAHVAHHSFVVAPFPALRVQSSSRRSGIVKTRVLRKVGANQHWPYGLVDAEGSEFYARQLDGNFFADVKNSDLFLQALKEDAGEKQVDADAHLKTEDAGEKQVDADAHLKTVRLNAKKFMQGSTIVDRESFIQSLTDAIFEDGLLTLVLGGKSVGKSTVIRSVGFVSLVRRAGKGIAIIVDEANIALPRDDDLTEAKASRDALAEIISITKQNVKASVVLISSEHGYPFKLAKAGLNLADIQDVIIAPEVPPNDMFKMLTGHWGMGYRLARL